MRSSKSIYSIYLFCITLFVCTSNDAIGSIRIIPLTILTLYTLYIFLTDLGGVITAIRKTKFVFLFTVLIVFGLSRNNLPNITPAMTIFRMLSLALFYIMTSHILLVLFRRNETRRILNLVIIPFLVLAILNIVFFFVGLSKEAIVAKDTSILMSLVGVSNFNRVNFYLVGGVNSYGSLNGVCIVIMIFSYLNKIHSRKFIYVSGLVFLIVAFFTDSRASLLFAVISVGLGLYYIKRKRYLVLNLLPYVAFFAPFLMFYLMPLLAQFEFFSFLSRGEGDIATGNSRFLIWGLIANDMVTNSSLSIFGFGDGGLYETASYKLIADLFTQYDDIIINTQNSIISIVLDYGLIALVIFFIILFKTINRIKRFWAYNPVLFLTLAALLFYLLLIGITEAVIGMYYQNAFVIFIYIFCLPFCMPVGEASKNLSK